MVPTGRQAPIGLDVRRFLGPASPFGADPSAQKKAEMSDAELIKELGAQSEQMQLLLLGMLKFERKALEHVTASTTVRARMPAVAGMLAVCTARPLCGTPQAGHAAKPHQGGLDDLE